MEVETCTNPKCGKKFTVTEIGIAVPGGSESEPIECPHCHTIVRTQRSSGTFRTTPV